MCVRKFLRIFVFGLLRCFRSLRRRVLSKLRFKNTRQINMSDNECEYDSTWEDEHENKTPRNKGLDDDDDDDDEFYSKMNYRNTFAARDMQNFRHSCRGLDDDVDDDDDDDDDEGRFYNLRFYRGQIKSSPDNVYINDFHQKWRGTYQKLEDVHSYIQWLFPIQEPGVNWRAHVLKKKEIKLFRKDEKVKKKLVKSYELMLDFYGIRLVDKSTGKVECAPNWEDRFRNLNRHTHNNLRITRILKCLGTLGLEHYQAPLVRFFLHETLVMGHLPNVKQSVLDYFMFAVLNKLERQKLVRYAFENFKPRKHFVWGPKNILSAQVVQQTEEKSPCQGSGTEKMDVDEGSEDKQNREKPCESKDEVNKIEPNHNSKEIESKEDHQNKEDKEEQVIPSNSGSHQTEEKSPCQGSETEKMDVDEGSEDKQNREKPCESKDEVNKIEPNHNSKEIESKEDHQNKEDKEEQVIPSNSGSHQTEEKSPCQGSETEKMDVDEGSEDKQNREKSCESKDEVNKIDPNHNSEEIESQEDHQNKEDKEEQVIPSNSGSHQTEEKSPCQGSGTEMRTVESKKDDQKKDELTETSNPQGSNLNSHCILENESVVRQNQEVGVGDSDADDNENIEPANKSHGHDAVSGSHQTEKEMDETKKQNKTKKESEDEQKTLKPHESKHEINIRHEINHPSEAIES